MKKVMTRLIAFFLCSSIVVMSTRYNTNAEIRKVASDVAVIGVDDSQATIDNSIVTATPSTESLPTTTPTAPPVEKKSREIYASDVVEIYKKNKTVTLNAWAYGDYNFSYRSSDTRVADISTSGKVTIKGCGETVITISDNGTDEYKPASKEIKVTIFPSTPVVKKASSTAKGRIYFAWKKIGILKEYEKSGYEVILERPDSRNIKEFGSKKKDVTISGLKSKVKYTIAIRSYVIINDKKYYSSWSKIKTVKVK